MSRYLLFIGCCCLAAAVLATAQIPITPRECGVNEKFLPCGPSCQTECATLGDPCLIRHIRCPDGCYCNEGFARDSTGTCIPIEKCKKKNRGSGSYGK